MLARLNILQWMRLRGAEDLLQNTDKIENDEHDNFITHGPFINAALPNIVRILARSSDR
jgi:hypothetical protein